MPDSRWIEEKEEGLFAKPRCKDMDTSLKEVRG